MHGFKNRPVKLSAAAGFLWLVLLFINTAVQAQTPRFDQLRERFERGEILNSLFTHDYHDSYTGEQTRTQGEIWIGREKYRVESDQQIMVVDGGISRVYDGIRNRVLISDYVEEEDDFAPSRMLQGVDETYDIVEEEIAGGTVVTLTTDDPFAVFTHVEIRLGEAGLPQVIEARDQVDNILTTRFQEGQFIQPEPGLFEMEPPGDAERIDLRH
ncbi:MAG: outer membrane lipoprotein carrier protein LolA [Balneolaceae bacterium]